MWLTGDSEIVKTESLDGNSSWLVDTLKSAIATSAAVVMAAGIARIQDYVVNIGVPAQHKIGNGNGNFTTTNASSQGTMTYEDKSQLRNDLIYPY